MNNPKSLGFRSTTKSLFDEYKRCSTLACETMSTLPDIHIVMYNGEVVYTTFDEDMQALDAFLQWSLQHDQIQPVPQVLCTAELNALCPKQVFSKNVRLPNDDQCVICCDAFRTRRHVRRLPCGHLYCSKCIEKWVTTEKATCPSCRAHVTQPQ